MIKVVVKDETMSSQSVGEKVKRKMKRKEMINEDMTGQAVKIQRNERMNELIGQQRGRCWDEGDRPGS